MVKSRCGNVAVLRKEIRALNLRIDGLVQFWFTLTEWTP